jgi:iron complex outermembrane receptor protein
MRHFINRALLLTAGASALVTVNTGYAAESGETATLEEVVVTAERREVDVQKIAASVSVRTGEDLQSQGRYSLAQILENIPGVSGGAQENSGTSAGAGSDSPGNGVVIRGIRSNLGTGGSITSTASSAATYVDDVYQGIGGNYDISRVEVLRGPQGTLYGRSAVSGAVGTYTANPSLDKFGGNASAEYGANEVGGRHVQRYTGAVNVPVNDQIAIRFAANRYSQGGIYEDHSSGKNKQTAGKVKILYKPNDDVSVLIGGAVQNNTSWSGSTGVTITQPVPDQVVVTRTPIASFYPGTNSSRQLWAKLDWNLGFATLTYLPAFRNYRDSLLVDLTATNVNCNTLTTPQQLAANQTCFQQPTHTDIDEFITHEIRLASNPDSKLSWQAGGMYYLNNLKNHADNEYVNPIDGLNTWVDSCNYFPYNYEGSVCTKGGNTKYLIYSDTVKRTAAIGVFAEATYPVTDALRFTGGLRYDYTKVADHQYFYAHGVASCIGSTGLNVNLGVAPCTLVPDNGVRRFFNTTWKARVEYDLTPENMLYATVSTGASPGDVALTVGGDSKPKVLTMDAQTLTSFDIGTKNRFLDNKLQANADVYYQDYGGYQLSNVNVGALDPIFTSIILPVKFYGFDADFLYQITTRDRVGFNMAYTHGWYVDQSQYLYTSAASPFPPPNGSPAQVVTVGDYVYSKTVEGIVPWTANLNYDHTFALNGGSRVALHGDVKYTSSYDPSRVSKAQYLAGGVGPRAHVSDAYIFNMNVMWTSSGGKLSLNGYVRNLFDNRYKTGGGCGFSGNCSVVSNTTATLYDPRSYGIVASVNF